MQFLRSTLPTALHLHAADEGELRGKVEGLLAALVGQHVTLLFGGGSPVREAAAAVRGVVSQLLAAVSRGCYYPNVIYNGHTAR